MTSVKSGLVRIWKSAQLYIGFHVDQEGRRRSEAKVWPPKNANATIHDDPSTQEAFLVVKSADRDAPRDIQIKLRSDKIVIRRDAGPGWDGLIVENETISIQVGGAWVRVKGDGSVSQDLDGATTHIESDGSVLKRTEYAEAIMSGDGVEMSRKTDNTIAAIRKDGVLAKSTD